MTLEHSEYRPESFVVLLGGRVDVNKHSVSDIVAHLQAEIKMDMVHQKKSHWERSTKHLLRGPFKPEFDIRESPKIQTNQNDSSQPQMKVFIPRRQSACLGREHQGAQGPFIHNKAS